MNWSVLSLLHSVTVVLGRVIARPFSKHQTLVALLAWFADQPPDDQARMVWNYLQSQPGSDRPPRLPDPLAR